MLGNETSRVGRASSKQHITSSAVVDDWPMYLIRTKSSDYLYYSRSSHWFWSIIYLYIKQLCNRYKGRACAVVKVIDLEAFQCDFADLRRETQLMSLFQYSTLLRVRGGCWINGSKLHTLQLVS